MDIILNSKELKEIQDMIRVNIREFYDDPDSDKKEVLEIYNNLKNICSKFRLVFDIIVEVEASEFEINRIKEILKDEYV